MRFFHLIQYRLWPHLALSSASTRRRKELTKRWTKLFGRLFHSAINAFVSWRIFCGAWCRRTFLPSRSQICSIGFISGDIAGHRMVLTLSAAKRARVILAVWGRALSCWNTTGQFHCINGIASAFKTSLMYLSAFKLPCITISRSFVHPLFHPIPWRFHHWNDHAV
jgi:hypothetical protein